MLSCLAETMLASNPKTFRVKPTYPNEVGAPKAHPHDHFFVLVYTPTKRKKKKRERKSTERAVPKKNLKMNYTIRHGDNSPSSLKNTLWARHQPNDPFTCAAGLSSFPTARENPPTYACLVHVPWQTLSFLLLPPTLRPPSVSLTHHQPFS